MSTIVINDLEINQDLDTQAAAGITGGFNVRRGLLKLADKAGKAIGTKLDEEYDVSDSASDAAIDTFGPAPKWLQNWF